MFHISFVKHFFNTAEKWWISITSDQDEEALVTAVAYDIAERPRVDIQFGKRSGVIMVEEGQLEVFTQLLPAQPTTKVVVNIDTAKFLSFADTYKVYVNKITLSSVANFLANVSFKDFAQLLGSINKASFRSAAASPSLSARRFLPDHPMR